MNAPLHSGADTASDEFVLVPREMLFDWRQRVATWHDDKSIYDVIYRDIKDLLAAHPNGLPEFAAPPAAQPSEGWLSFAECIAFIRERGQGEMDGACDTVADALEHHFSAQPSNQLCPNCEEYTLKVTNSGLSPTEMQNELGAAFETMKHAIEHMDTEHLDAARSALTWSLDRADKLGIGKQPSNALSGVHAYAIYDDKTGKFLGYGSDDKPFNSEGKRARAVPVMGKLADLQASNALSGKLRERAKIMDATGQFALSYFNQSDAWLMRSAADALEAMKP